MSRRLKILIAVGIVLGVAILIPVIHHYQLRAATEAYIAQLKAKGEPMDLAQVIPPPLPPEQNSASNFFKAVSLLGYELRTCFGQQFADCHAYDRPGKSNNWLDATRYPIVNGRGKKIMGRS